MTLYKSTKASHVSFDEDEQFLYFGTFVYFTLFEFDIDNMTLGNYG